MDFYTSLAVLFLAGFVGYAVISKVPNTLHTPLMSGTNAIHGIIMMGAIIVLGLESSGPLNKVLVVVAVAFGTINVVGGFLVTDRMLEMFKPKAKKPAAAPAAALAGSPSRNGAASTATSSPTPASPAATAPGAASPAGTTPGAGTKPGAGTTPGAPS
ncbi:MAG TPA: proton-translocating transhydrogenase family protein [Acidimicrobiales bacterium]|nr:proton-translocating transhydrogenase family protein [Acidimicrobiales bacterium]